jgi:hypothetical protein
LGSSAARPSPRWQHRDHVLYASFNHRFSGLIFFLRVSNEFIFRHVYFAAAAAEHLKQTHCAGTIGDVTRCTRNTLTQRGSLCEQQLQLPHALVERLARLRQHRLQGEGAVDGFAVDQARAAAGSLKTIFQY